MSLTDGGCTSSLPGSEIDWRESSPASKTRRPDESRSSPADGSKRRASALSSARYVTSEPSGRSLKMSPFGSKASELGSCCSGVGAAHRCRGDARDVIGAVRDEATPAVADPPRLVDDRRRLELRARRGERRVAAEEGRPARRRHLDRLRRHAPGPFKEVGIVDVRRVESVAPLRQRLLAHAPSQRRQRAGVVRGQRGGRERPRGCPADAVAERLAPRALSWWRCGLASRPLLSRRRRSGRGTDQEEQHSVASMEHLSGLRKRTANPALSTSSMRARPSDDVAVAGAGW